jgi:sensor histidine kinase YesM
MLEKNSIQLSSTIRKYSFDRYVSGLLFIVLTMIAITRAFQHIYIVDVYEPVQYGLWWHIPFNLFLWWSWFLFVPVLYWIAVRITIDTHKLLYWLIVCFFLPIVIVLIRQTVASFIITSILADKNDFNAMLHWRMFNNPWVWLDMIVYFAIIMGIRIVEYQHQSKLNELRFSKLQAQLAQSQLSALESQLHPHFLFNTLNTVSTLILKADNKEAERMLSLLKKLIRTTLYESERQEITLEEELRFINHYLEIEKVRFNDKLKVKEDIAKDTLKAQVPNFLLQPIVENAIYHAIAPKISNGILWLTSKKENGYLSIIVEDNGTGMGLTRKQKKSKEGVGLKITKERLAHLFGENHQFLLDKGALGGLRVTIRIPFLNSKHPAKVQ